MNRPMSTKMHPELEIIDTNHAKYTAQMEHIEALREAIRVTMSRVNLSGM
jgi:hypothetical protein